MESYKKLLLANKAWVKDRTEVKPDYFKELARDQKPEFLWIGCSDSRVPAEEITGTEPGELFVHRNIANLVVSTDFNLLSVVQYAVDALGVRHIIVCGHHGCGGVRAALSHQRFGLLNKWLRHIKEVYAKHADVFRGLHAESERVNKLVELNVVAQVENLAKTSIVQAMWKRHQRPMLHGWVYGMDDGLIKQVSMMGPDSEIDDIFRYDLD